MTKNKREWEEEFDEEFGNNVYEQLGFDDYRLIDEKIISFISKVENQAYQRAVEEERKNWDSILDGDSCECDNCHRTRKYLENPEKELHKVRQKLQALKGEEIR